MSKNVAAKNEVIANAIAVSLSKRFDEEKLNAAHANSLNFISRCALTVQSESVFALLTASAVNVDFAHDKRVEGKKMCMKAIDSVNSLLQFATRDNVKTLKSNVEECLRTIINFKNAKRTFTTRDLEDCLNASAKIADDKKALIYQRRTQFDAFNRHALMTLRALHALNLVTVKSKSEFEVNDNALMQALEKKIAA
jgi:hypothetical protein